MYKHNYNKKFDLITTKRNQKVFLGHKFIMSKKGSTYISYAHVKEALSKCTMMFDEKDMTWVTIDLGRIVGKECCVSVTDANKYSVQWLYRKGTQGKTPIILNGKCNETRFLTFGVIRDEKDKDLFRVCAAYYGHKATRLPYDSNIKSEEERKECEEFWNTHALIMSDKVIDWEKSERVS